METTEDHNKLAKTQSICSVYENIFKCATQPNDLGASVDQETFPFIILPATLHLWFHHLENEAKDEEQTDQKELQQNLDAAALESVEEQPRSWQKEERLK